MDDIQPPKKMLILNILDVLKKYTDENHRLSAREIGEILQREYAQAVDRKAVKRNLMNLIDFGYDIEYSETTRSNKGGEETVYSDWYLNRDFIDAELRLLIDSLLFSRHIPAAQRKQLIAKLEGLSNIYFKSKVRHIRNIPEQLLDNKELFYIIDILDEAISGKKRVAFLYTDYGMDMRPRPHADKSGQPVEYRVSPYQMAAANGRYYLICVHERYDNVSHYRIDRISGIRILDEPVTPMKDIPALKNGLDLPKHMAEHIYMFSGASVLVRFRAKQYLIGDILDWFGKNTLLTSDGDDGVIVEIRANEQAMFYWAMQYGEHIEVLEPGGLRERIKNAAVDMAKKYEKGQ